MSKAQENSATASSHARASGRGLAVLLSAVVLGVGASTAAGASEEIGAGGTTQPNASPPTAEQVEAWDQASLRSDGISKTSAPVPLKGGAPGGKLFPGVKVLSLYGMAGGFGVLGRKSLDEAAQKLNRQIRPYRKRSNERVVKAFDLVAVVATSCSGARDRCRTRVSKETIRRYHRKIRSINGRLILDIQPGRANVIDEMDHFRNFIQKPDVDVAIDAEWNMAEGEEPGQDLGSIGAKKVNRAAKMMKRIIANHNLPPKALIVHQFRRDSVKGESNINRPPPVDVTLNFDGIGSPSAKKAGYKDLSFPGLFNGFSLFYKLDTNLMSPRQVLGLRPQPDYIMYQ